MLAWQFGQRRARVSFARWPAWNCTASSARAAEMVIAPPFGTPAERDPRSREAAAKRAATGPDVQAVEDCADEQPPTAPQTTVEQTGRSPAHRTGRTT